MLKKLQARLAQIKADAQAIVDAADADNNGIMTDDQVKQFDALIEERDQVQAQIKRHEQLQSMDESAGRVATPAQPGSASEGATAAPAGSLARVTKEEDPMCGFSSGAEFAAAVQVACQRGGGFVDERLKVLGTPSNFHQETGSSDGYQVPPQMRDEIWELTLAEEDVLSFVNPEPTGGNQVGFVKDETTPWGSTGVTAYWAAEGSQMTASKLADKMGQLRLHKMHALVLATDELLEDAPRLQSRLTRSAAAAIRFKAGEAIFEGDGVGKPHGWMNGNCLVTVPKESGQAAATLTADNVAKMYSRLLMGGGVPAWFINQDVLPELMTMTLNDRAIWTPPNEGFKQAPGGRLLGLPIRFSEHCETLGTKGDIQLVNPAGYYAANKSSGLKFSSSLHLYFDYDIEAFKWTFRLGGQPILSAAVDPNKGTNKRSHFVTLATRS